MSLTVDVCARPELGVMAPSGRLADDILCECPGLWARRLAGLSAVLVHRSTEILASYLRPIPPSHERIAYHKDQVDQKIHINIMRGSRHVGNGNI